MYDLASFIHRFVSLTGGVGNIQWRPPIIIDETGVRIFTLKVMARHSRN
jgi:hypothetical protein